MPPRKPALLPPPGLTEQEAQAMPVSAAPPPAFARALAETLNRVFEIHPPAETGATLALEDPAMVAASRLKVEGNV